MLLAIAVRAPAADLQSKLNNDRSKLGKVQSRQGNVADQIASLNQQVDTLLGQVSSLQAQRDQVQQQLDAKQNQLDRATAALARERKHLQAVRAQLARALKVLRQRLVAMYESGSPDAVSVVLGAKSWSDVVSQSAYLERIQSYDTQIIARVRTLRDQTQNAVERRKAAKATIKHARDALVGQEQDLADTQARLQAQHAQLISAQTERQNLLDSLQGTAKDLQKSITKAEARLEPPATSAVTGTAPPPAPPPVPGDTATLLPNGQAAPPANAPAAVQAVIQAANSIATTPYIWGGGHGSFDSSGYDCSGAVSFALNGGGFLDSPLDSTGLEFWGESGAGSWITVYANSGHAFAIIAGLRWDTVGDTSGTGPRWHSDVDGEDLGAFVPRHPLGY